MHDDANRRRRYVHLGFAWIAFGIAWALLGGCGRAPSVQDACFGQYECPVQGAASRRAVFNDWRTN